MTQANRNINVSQTAKILALLLMSDAPTEDESAAVIAYARLVRDVKSRVAEKNKAYPAFSRVLYAQHPTVGQELKTTIALNPDAITVVEDALAMEYAARMG